MGSSSTSLIEMSMCDAAFHDIPCHHAIQEPQGDNQETIDMVVSWFCFLQARLRCMFAYQIPNDATWHTRENVSYYLCCAAKCYKQKRIIWF